LKKTLDDPSPLAHHRRTSVSGTPISSFDYFNENTQDKEGLFSLAYLGYDRRLGESTRIKVNAQYEGAGLEGLTTNRNLSLPDKQTVFQETLNPSTNPLHSILLKGDLFRKTPAGEWQAGFQIRRDVQDGDFRYLNRNLGENGFTLDPMFTSRVRLDNTIHAAYFQHNIRKGRLFMQDGLRFEHQHRVLDFSKNSDRRVLRLPSLFPSLTMRYELAKQSFLKAGYTRRVKRTNNYELNPFPEREHAETLEQGDPELLPELTGTWEAGWERSWNAATLSATVYRQAVKNPIQRVNKVFNDTILNRVFTNAGRATQIGFEANLNARITPWWQTVLGGNVYRYRIEGQIFSGTVPVDNASWVYSINALQTFHFTASTTLQLTVNYLSARATAQGEDGAFLTPHLSLKHVGKSKRWTWQFQWQNIDMGMERSNRQRITTFGPDFFTTTLYNYEPDQLQVSMSFNLNRKNRKILLPVSEMVEKEF
jgi:outer membrane receptor protein involved in Fe transport